MNHLTDLELSVMSDGAPLARDARLHLERCDECMNRFGEALLETDDLRAAMASRRAPSLSTVPRAWILVAATLGVIGAFPMLREFDATLLHMVRTGRAVRHFGPLVAKGFVATGGPLWVAFVFVTAAFALLGSLAFRKWSKA